MSVKNNLIGVLKSALIKLEAEGEKPAEEVKLAEAVMADGTKIVTPAESFGTGAEVFVMNEAGEQTPLTDGVYEVGEMTITVVAGLISEIVEKEAEVEVEPDLAKYEEELAGMKKEKEDLMKEREEMGVKLSAIEKELSDAKTKLAELETAKNEEVVKLSKQIEELTTPAFDSLLKLSAEQKKIEAQRAINDLPKNKKALLKFRANA